MTETHTKTPQVWLLLMAACLVLATLAPIDVPFRVPPVMVAFGVVSVEKAPVDGVMLPIWVPLIWPPVMSTFDAV